MLGAGAIGSATGFDPAGCVFESHALCQISLDKLVFCDIITNNE